MAIITLTTDFGTRDGYVGAMKGVLMRLAREPGADIVVDITHDIPRGDVAHAAWVVATSCREFPENTIHIVVVDPGFNSGTARRGVVIDAYGSYYIGRDNGVFAYLEAQWARAIEHTRAIAPEVSPTFHGRDVFATAAAALARKIDPTAIGAQIELAGTLPWGKRPDQEGRVVHVDHFGNLVTDLPTDEAGDAVAIAGRRLEVMRAYTDVEPGTLLAYVGSARTIEIAVRDRRADRVLDAPRGTPIVPVPAGTEFR
jgi:S-adenosyl-L-methionine hydrolase (adenosine-forming)